MIVGTSEITVLQFLRYSPKPFDTVMYQTYSSKEYLNTLIESGFIKRFKNDRIGVTGAGFAVLLLHEKLKELKPKILGCWC